MFQLSSCYKSSAELVSELLQRPVLLTNFKQGSEKGEFDAEWVKNSNELEVNQKKKLTISKSETMKLSDQLKSVELVKTIGHIQRKVGRDERSNNQIPNIGRQLTRDQVRIDKLLTYSPDSDQSMESTADSICSQSSEGGCTINNFLTHSNCTILLSGYEVKICVDEKDKDNINTNTNNQPTNKYVIIMNISS